MTRTGRRNSWLRLY